MFLEDSYDATITQGKRLIRSRIPNSQAKIIIAKFVKAIEVAKKAKATGNLALLATIPVEAKEPLKTLITILPRGGVRNVYIGLLKLVVKMIKHIAEGTFSFEEFEYANIYYAEGIKKSLPKTKCQPL